MTKRLLATGALLGVALFARPSAAQAISGEFTIQRFDPAPGPRNFVTTRGARTDGEMAWSAGLVFNYAVDPFVLKSCESATNCDDPSAGQPIDVEVVQNVTTLDLMGSLTPFPMLQLGLRLPVTRAAGQGLTEQGHAAPALLEAFGVGDAMLEAKLRMSSDRYAAFVPGLAVFATGPLGTLTAKESYIGDDTPTVGGRAIFDLLFGRLAITPNVGGVFRGTSRVGETEVGPEARWGLGVGYKAAPTLEILADAFGAVGLASQNRVNAAEIDAGLRFVPHGWLVGFVAGGGVGATDEVGVPSYRIFAGISLTAERIDRDGDGVPDAEDACPTAPERESDEGPRDGCPSDDDDGDLIPNKADKCPKVAEDADDFEDLDGCPDPDNDGDGVPDTADKCPDERETVNGYDDDDGCPDEPDRDRDGVPDSRDVCRNDPEDTDGYKDDDGCPDPDNDKDGIPDKDDQCVNSPETKNGIDDEDGCPD